MKLSDILSHSHQYIMGEMLPKEQYYDPYVGQGGTPYAIVYPLTHDEVVACVRFAIKHHLTIVTQGAQTGLSGATFTNGNELVIDLSRMNQILELNAKAFTLTVEPGVTLEAIQKTVEAQNFFYPPDPGSKHSSIGGNVATNAGGMRAVKYGVTRDYVRELTVVLATGETVILGSENIKSSSGYDLKHLLIGSEGTLGIITNIKLKLIALPKHKRSYLASFSSLHASTQSVLDILQQGLNPTALEFFEKELVTLAQAMSGITLPIHSGASFLLITLDGDAIDSREQQLLNCLHKHHALEVQMLSETNEIEVWHLRDQLLSAVVNYSEQVTLDETVPINKLSEMYEYTKLLEKKHNISILSFGHAGDGNLHTCIIKGDTSDKEWPDKRDAILVALYDKIEQLGGLPSAEHGIGIIKRAHFLKMFDPEVIALMRLVKRAFDPDQRLNPGKIF